ncbi:MAG TPA: SDR family NAD(P)-dependent oxidoreductase [Acidimicrobiales bacterium]|nr:SDR family NAD(P)-dependent oxidoreductase [Acidimicrobiales bacterium]
MSGPQRRVAVVTGAGRGLGRGIAMALAASGLDLVLGWHRDKEALADTVAACRDQGAVVEELQGDVTEPGTAEQLAALAQRAFGALDVWVNNAGVSVYAPVLDTSVAAMRRMVDVNLLGTFHGVQAAGRSMLDTATAGRIVNVASDLGVQAAPGLGGYSATKFAVVGLTQAAAVELGPAGITVNAVCPGTVETDMVLAEEQAEAALHGIGLDDVRRRLLAAVPAGRLCTTEDVGRMIAWLAGPDAAYVNGQALCVNGGSVLH